MSDYFKDNQWCDAYMWLWYNDEEIFAYTQEDWDKKEDISVSHRIQNR